jgi:beta-glucosidase
MQEFLWGAATSSHQIEGGNQHNDWWKWEQEGNIEGGARSGAACDHWNRFEEDLDLAVLLGMNTYRFSVEWSRIEPKQDEWNLEALDWYKNLVAGCEKRGLLPMLTLHHFTSPQWFAEKGGFTWEQAPQRFLQFTRKVIEAVGPRIPLWCTLNEPMVLVGGGYLGTFMPPAKFDPIGASKACAGLLKSHALAYDAIHAEVRERAGPWKDHPIQVGIAHNLIDFMPERKWHPFERLFSHYLISFYNRAWLDAVTGKKPKFHVPFFIPKAPMVPEALGRKTVDFLGINYYTKGYIQFMPRDAAHPRPAQSPIGLSFAKRHEEASDVDWAVHPDGFRKMIRLVAEYGLPIYITENGIADREDRLRAKYLKLHLQALAECIEEEADVRGYYHWSLIDNFEWIKGFGPRFGLIHIDYDTFARRPRESARLFKQIVEAHRVDGRLLPPKKSELDRFSQTTA